MGGRGFAPRSVLSKMRIGIFLLSPSTVSETDFCSLDLQTERASSSPFPQGGYIMTSLPTPEEGAVL